MIECHASCLKEGSSSSSSGSKGWVAMAAVVASRLPQPQQPSPTGPITQPPSNDVKMFVKMSLVLSALLTCV